MSSHVHSMHMRFLTPVERVQAAAIAGLAYGNPFLPERIAHEHAVLGDEFIAADAGWTRRPGREVQNANLEKIGARAEALARALHRRLVDGARPSDDETRLFEDVVLYVLYHRHEGALWELID